MNLGAHWSYWESELQPSFCFFCFFVFVNPRHATHPSGPSGTSIPNQKDEASGKLTAIASQAPNAQGHSDQVKIPHS